MKYRIKRGLAVFLCLVLGSLSLAGCQPKESPEDVLKAQIESISSSSSGYCEQLLEADLEEEGITDFPDELVDAYASFLREVYKKMDYEVASVRKDGDTTEITLDVAVLDLGATVESMNSEYVANMQSDNLATEVKELLVLDQDQLAQPSYSGSVTLRIHVTWDVEKEIYLVEEEAFQKLLDTAVTDRLAAYHAVADIFDVRDYVTACLDASYKGEFEEYCTQTGISEEEARQDYENSFWDSEMDSSGFGPEEKEQLTSAMKEIAKSADYTAGVPVKEGEDSYTVQVTGTSLLSFQKALEEINTAVTNGSVADEAALRTLFVKTFQKYADSPAWGDAYTVTVHVTPEDGFALSIPDEDVQSLMNAVLPQ